MKTDVRPKSFFYFFPKKSIRTVFVQFSIFKPFFLSFALTVFVFVTHFFVPFYFFNPFYFGTVLFFNPIFLKPFFFFCIFSPFYCFLFIFSLFFNFFNFFNVFFFLVALRDSRPSCSRDWK